MVDRYDRARGNRALSVAWHNALWLATALCVLLLSAAAHSATDAPQQRMGDDLYTSAGELSLQSDVPGAAFVSGGRVSLNGAIGRDAVVAGGSVDVRSRIGQDLYAAGGEVRVADAVGGNARIAGGRVVIAPQAAIAGNATIAGGNVTLDGSVGGYALISAGRVQINGRVDGDLNVVGGSLSLGPDAVILGKLQYRGAQAASIAQGAQVQGGVEQSVVERDFGAPTGLLMVWLIALVVAVAVLLACVPRLSRHVAQIPRTRPLAALLLGTALLVGLPVLALLLLFTVVGIPLGLFAIAAWLMLILLAWFVSAIAMGDAVVDKAGVAGKGKRIVAAALAVLVLFLLAKIPFVGWVVCMLALLFGAGAIALAVFGALRVRPQAVTGV